MRLREIQTIINLYLPTIEPTTEPTRLPDGATNAFQLNNLHVSRESLSQLRRIDQLRPYVESIITHPYLQNYENGLIVHANAWATVSSRLNLLKDRAQVLKGLVDQALPPESPLAISIEIPRPESLEDLGDIISDITFIFDRVSGNDLKPAVLQNFDTGSFWLEVVPDGLKAVATLIAIAQASIFLKQQAMKFAAELKRDEALGAVKEDIEASAKHKEKLRGLVFERLANDIAEKRYGAKKTHEDVAMMMRLIEREQKLMERGMKMFPAWNASTEVKASFPDFNKPLLSIDENERLVTPSFPNLLPPSTQELE